MGYILKASNAKGESGLNRYISMLAGNTATPVIIDTGAMFPIAMAVVGSTNLSYIEFTSIPSTYKHLQLRFFGGFNTSNASGLTYINGDTTNSNYYSHHMQGNGSAASSQNYNVPYNPIANGNTALTPSSYTMDFLDYTSTAKRKVIRSLGGYDANGTGQIYFSSVLWNNTAAINAIRIQCDGGYSWTNGVRAALYGILG